MSQGHFEGKYEVELKYRLPSKANFMATLDQLEHEVMLVENTEQDHYFDLPDHSLALGNKSVCIRRMMPSGIQLWIVKGPEKDRCEAVNISDCDKAESMLTTMGYQCVLKMHKTRSIYFIDEFHITVDQLDGIGDFAEFAIMTDDESRLDDYQQQLTQLASQFGLAAQHLEHRSYRELYTQSLG
ncbi:class IV adenylate cyclase [Photobacterium sp. TY1-4]|uniref:class IV adenylate cyclase n=1 Tax=Photobacterium sp. TY1-4 TaxID=2899122 RepID=UPI0021C199D8|nr:class IV adenylate cyclase [Photobacterium sp. TY1-4]UXI02622.1 class IV adenylate cyclase [Photobacterium sp. TY1-4]